MKSAIRAAVACASMLSLPMAKGIASNELAVRIHILQKNEMYDSSRLGSFFKNDWWNVNWTDARYQTELMGFNVLDAARPPKSFLLERVIKNGNNLGLSIIYIPKESFVGSGIVETTAKKALSIELDLATAPMSAHELKTGLSKDLMILRENLCLLDLRHAILTEDRLKELAQFKKLQFIALPWFGNVLNSPNFQMPPDIKQLVLYNTELSTESIGKIAHAKNLERIVFVNCWVSVNSNWKVNKDNLGISLIESKPFNQMFQPLGGVSSCDIVNCGEEFIYAFSQSKWQALESLVLWNANSMPVTNAFQSNLGPNKAFPSLRNILQISIKDRAGYIAFKKNYLENQTSYKTAEQKRNLKYERRVKVEYLFDRGTLPVSGDTQIVPPSDKNPLGE